MQGKNLQGHCNIWSSWQIRRFLSRHLPRKILYMPDDDRLCQGVLYTRRQLEEFLHPFWNPYVARHPHLTCYQHLKRSLLSHSPLENISHCPFPNPDVPPWLRLNGHNLSKSTQRHDVWGNKANLRYAQSWWFKVEDTSKALELGVSLVTFDPLKGRP